MAKKFVDGLYLENRTGNKYLIFLIKHYPGIKGNAVICIHAGTRWRKPFALPVSGVFEQTGFVPRFRLIAPRLKRKTAAK